MCAVFAPGRVINFGSSRGERETYHYDPGGIRPVTESDVDKPWGGEGGEGVQPCSQPLSPRSRYSVELRAFAYDTRRTAHLRDVIARRNPIQIISSGKLNSWSRLVSRTSALNFGRENRRNTDIPDVSIPGKRIFRSGVVSSMNREMSCKNNRRYSSFISTLENFAFGSVSLFFSFYSSECT